MADGKGVEGSKPGAEAAACAELVRQWPEAMKAHQPHDEARAAATARVADLVATAERRADAARMQTYPLPRRVTDAYLRDLWATCSRSLNARPAAAERAILSLDAHLLKEIRGLGGICQSLVDAAHLAGLQWALTGDGPGVTAVQAWCADFVEVSARVHEAMMLVQTVIVPEHPAVDRLIASLRGEKQTKLSASVSAMV